MGESYQVLSDQNFVRIFVLPPGFSGDFCFQGPIPTTFGMVDWFYPHDQFSHFPIVLEGEDLDAHRKSMREFIKLKPYYNPKYKYIAITEYGDAFMI
jgi:hypothetical protein